MASAGEVVLNADQGHDVTLEITQRSNVGLTNKRERSVVWQYFTKKFIPGSDTQYDQVMCNYCKSMLKCTSSNGTSSCRNHAKRCKRNPLFETDHAQSALSFGKNENNEHDSLLAWKFDQDVSRAALVRMIIVDEMPFVTVERDGFKGFVRTIQPKFKIMSRVTVARDCLHLYASERLKLKEFMKNNVQRVSLTTDLWTSLQNQSYLCLTAHFIDSQWNLHKRIINFCVIGDHTGDSIGKMIEMCLKNWSIERVCTITVDNASANDVGIAYLRRKLVARNNVVLDGEYLHVRCCAHILNLIVKDGLVECDSAVKRIRATIKYIRSSPKRARQFGGCLKHENMLETTKGASLALDVCTRWNSTYIMLSAALKFEKAFNRMTIEDMFDGLKDGPPTTEDWEQAKVLVKFLAIFYDCTRRLSGTLYVTSTLYFQEVCTIKSAIKEWGKSGNSRLRLMSNRMMEKFEKYWENLNKVNMMLMVAAVLDPRVKMTKLDFLIDKLKRSGEGCDLLGLTQEALKSLFNFYSSGNESSNSVGGARSELQFDMLDHDTDVDMAKNWDLEFEKRLESLHKEDGRTELDRYLAAKNVKNDVNFDILGWWKMNAPEYPILSTMAKDILAIPVSTVASESAFSTGSRVLDPFRSSLTPRTVECLICTQDWLRGSTLMSVEETLESLEEIEESAITGGIIDLCLDE